MIISHIYIVNYFGLLSKEKIQYLIDKYNNKIILDNTHSFFMKGFGNIDIIYNCRKYFGVPDGAYLYTKLNYEENYPIASSMNRIKHLFGRYEKTASEYYKDFIESDETFDNMDIEMMSKITHNMLKSIDYNRILKNRLSNYNYLHKNLSKYNELKIDDLSSHDFMFPLLISNGKEIRKKLIENKIFVPKLWPDLDKFELNGFEQKIFNDLILLPIDQRYNKEDMEYLCNLIKEIVNELR